MKVGIPLRCQRRSSGRPIDADITFRTGGPDSRDAWYMKNVVAADPGSLMLVLFSQMRDTAMSGRISGQVLNAFDVDGPGMQILDQLEYGLFNVKKSRMLISQSFRDLQTELVLRRLRI